MTGGIVGVDVGGTFTDLAMLDPETGLVRLAKEPTTIQDQSFGVLAAIEAAQVNLADVALIVHGTTTTTNAVLERKLSRTGLITTQGFRDVLELGRRTRPNAYGMHGVFDPIIPRDLRIEVPERMDAQGRVVVALDEEAVSKAGRALLEAGCESVVVHFLHAYANASHERRAGELLRAFWPNDYITLGHALLSETREFERGVTAVVNGSVQPLLERYLASLRGALRERGLAGDVQVINGNGGMVSSRHVAREAAKTVMSGPASGVMAAAYVGRVAGYGGLLSYDMGGTSTDVALIRDGRPSVSNEIELEYGMPIHVPMVDVRTIGAGGGSIAWINAAGLLEIGPESAGADPGPICYGKGGTRPTISDANLLLGRLDPGRLNVAGGVSRASVEAAFLTQLADPLGVDVLTAAEAVIALADAKMSGAVRMVSLSLGADPRDFAIFAFGGAGPLHAASLARELGVPKVLVPARPGITNALGCMVADLRHDFVQTIGLPLETGDLSNLHDVFAAHTEEGETLLKAERVAIREITRLYSVDMQFAGQSHAVRVELPHGRPTRQELEVGFASAYWDRFRVTLENVPVVIVSAHSAIIGEREPISLHALIDPAGRRESPEPSGSRQVMFGGKLHDTPVFWRDHLPLDVRIDGPAIIEQMDTTILADPGCVVAGDPFGNLIMEVAP